MRTENIDKKCVSGIREALEQFGIGFLAELEKNVPCPKKLFIEKKHGFPVRGKPLSARIENCLW